MEAQKKILITQSNYIPWKGYFYAISEVDTFIIFDDMQFTKRDWRNRNVIKTKDGLKWLTIPVESKNKYFQRINETKVSDNNWHIKHLAILKQNYAKAKKYKESIGFIENLYMQNHSTYITEINRAFLTKICLYLGFEREILLSSDFELAEDRTDRIIDLCKKLNGTDYYTGPSARSYIENEKFTLGGINLHYFDFNGFPEYPQLYGDFIHSVSILDLIFSCGIDSKEFIKKSI
jgi:hypothetical protein